MSTGQTGHKPVGVPPKFFMFIGFFFRPRIAGVPPTLTESDSWSLLIVHADFLLMGDTNILLLDHDKRTEICSYCPPSPLQCLNCLQWSLAGSLIRNARLFIILFSAIFGGFVRNFGWVFAILFEVLLIENEEEIHHFPGWEGGGGQGAQKLWTKSLWTNWGILTKCPKTQRS